MPFASKRKRKQWAKKYHQKNRAAILRYQRKHNAKPKVKKRISAYMRKYYRRNKARIDRVSRRANKRMRARNRAFVQQYKSERGCVDCGEKDHRVLDFDHRPRCKKRFTIGHAMGEMGLDRLKKEIAKCVVRCANCHRRRHYNLRGGPGDQK